MNPFHQSSLHNTTSLMKRPPETSIIQYLKGFIVPFTALLFLSGCLSTRSITYFNYFQTTNQEPDELVTHMKSPYTPLVKPGDILSITVSSLDKDDRETFNPLPPISAHQTQFGGFIVLQPLQGFKVDTLGLIHFPQVGAIKVSGLTTKEVELQLTAQLLPYIKSPTVYVYIANFIISVLGEVQRPAQYVVPHNRITLPEAIALAGDLTIYGKRQNILIIRELEGQRIFGRVDLTNRNLFRSPYYYLHAGDVIYIEPTKGKLTSSDRTFQWAPIFISSLTFILLIINTFK